MRRYYLRQRSNGGKWYAVIMNTVTKKPDISRCTGTLDEKQAHYIAQEWLVNGPPNANRATKEISQLRNMAFCDFLLRVWDFDTSEYIKEKMTEGKQPKKSHPIEMQGVIKRYFMPYFKQTLLCEINEEKLTEFLVYLRTEKVKEKNKDKNKEQKKGLSVSTVKLVRNAAIVPLRYARRKKIIRDFDFDAVIKVNGDFEERGILDRDQAEALFKLEWRNPVSRLICLIASQTAMRIGEIRALRVCDILEDRINVQHSWSEDDGGLKCTKNRANRTIPILPELYQELTEYMKNTGRYSNLSNLVFPGKKEEKPFSHKQINKDFYEMLEKIGISDAERRDINIVFHSWRHYGAKHLAEVTNRNIGMAILGHKTPRLFDHYANHIDKDTFEGMKKAIKEGLSYGKNDDTKIKQFIVN
jgi:integrase